MYLVQLKLAHQQLPPISQAPKASPPSSSTSMHTTPPRLGSSAVMPRRHAAGLGLGPRNRREIPGGHPLIVDNNNSSQPLLDSPESIESIKVRTKKRSAFDRTPCPLLSPHFGQMRRWVVTKMGWEDIRATYCWIGLARGFGLNCPCICILW
jgi:hypothetical protein